MSYQSSKIRTPAPASSRPSSSTMHRATAETSPFFRANAPNGTQTAPFPIDDDDDDGPSSFTDVGSSPKRKRDDSAFIISDDEDVNKAAAKKGPVSKPRKTVASMTDTITKTPKGSQKKSKVASPEKRLRKFRDHPPASYQSRYERAITQRMFLIDRRKKIGGDEYGTFQEEVFDMAGTTGNVYQVTISKVPKCTCPDARKNNMHCKHMIYVSLPCLLILGIA